MSADLELQSGRLLLRAELTPALETDRHVDGADVADKLFALENNNNNKTTVVLCDGRCTTSSLKVREGEGAR